MTSKPCPDQSTDRLALPSPSNATSTTTLNTSNPSTVKLDQLGPLVVNSDGTLSRIQNWAGMTESERERTLRVLGKRNMIRQEKLATEEEGVEKEENEEKNPG